MTVGRVGFDAVELGDGSVLVVGDDHACFPGPAIPDSERAEIYEPWNDRWVEIVSLNKPRKTPATVRLADGSAMVIGGVNDKEVAFSSTKILSPSTRTWRDGPLLNVARGQPLATTLPDGRVLVASVVRQEETNTVATTEIYDPAVGKWARGHTVNIALGELMLLTDGRVLAVGSVFEIPLWLEVFDPASATWTTMDTPPQSHFDAKFIALNDGGVLAVGGISETQGVPVTAQVERYDPRLKSWLDATPMPTPRAGAVLVRLADGRVLAIGGYNSLPGSSWRALTTVEVFDPASGTWAVAGELTTPRYGAHALVLQDGSVLVLGGASDFNTEGETPWCPKPLTSVDRLAVP